MTIDIDMPDQIGDETAASIVDFLYALGDAVGARYDGQIRRHYQCRRQYPAAPRRRRAADPLPRDR